MKYCNKCKSSYPNEFRVCPIDNSPLQVTSELLPGMVIRDKYVILDKVGAGGMGTVYRARHLAFDEVRALKIVDAQLSEDSSFVKRFRTEAIVARKLQHPNAVRIDDLDSTEDGRPFIVMELVEGEDLKSLLAREGALSVPRAVNIAAQVADALSAAHRLGIVHRDIKPDNILISRSTSGGLAAHSNEDIVKVTDFGIAKVREGTLDVGPGYTLTRTGMIVGTPQYLSPEQAGGKQADQIDGRSDIYSLGIVLYQMLTGRLPFASETPMGFLMHHLQTQPVPPDMLRPDLRIPQPVSSVLMKCLEKDREMRFSNAEEVVEKLSAALQDLSAPLFCSSQQATELLAADLKPLQATAPFLPSLEVQRVAQPRTRSRRGVWIALTSLAILALLASAFVVTHFASLSGRNHEPTLTTPIANPSAASVEEDRRVRSEIEKALASLDETSIHVNVEDGVATLWGTSSSANRALAESLASETHGLRQVKNEIQVEAPRTAHNSSDVTRPIPTITKKQTSALRERASAQGAGVAQISAAEIEALISAGNQATENGEYDGAMADFGKVLDADPGNLGARAGMRRAIQAKQTEESVLK